MSLKTYDKFGLILRIETTVNDVGSFLHYRQVEQRDGTRVTKWTHMKKTLYSLPALREALRAANHRYFQFISTLADPSAGVVKLRKLSQTVIEHERSYRGFNLFSEEDQQLMQVLARGEFNIRGLQNRTLRDHLPEKNGGQVSRLLKRLRLHGFVKKSGSHVSLLPHPLRQRNHRRRAEAQRTGAHSSTRLHPGVVTQTF